MKGSSTHTIRALISLKEAIISISMHLTSHCKPAVLLGSATRDSLVKASNHSQGPECVFCRLFSLKMLISGFFLSILQNHNLSVINCLLLFSSELPASV